MQWLMYISLASSLWSGSLQTAASCHSVYINVNCLLAALTQVVVDTRLALYCGRFSVRHSVVCVSCVCTCVYVCVYVCM